MRDLLWYDPSTPPDAPSFEPDPVKRAQAAMRRDLPRRFWKDVALDSTVKGHHVLLDGRPVKTPGKRALVLPKIELAEAVAEEWRAQETFLDPATMPLTRLANSVVDGVADRFAEVADDAAKYAGTDLVCYRAESPDRLVERQTAGWDPLLDWIEDTHGARLLVAEGIVHVAQDGEALARLRAVLDGFDAWRLAGFHTLNASMFKLAYNYAKTGMSAFVSLQEEEFQMEREWGFKAVKHQRFVGAGYFDQIQQTVAGGEVATAALKGPTGSSVRPSRAAASIASRAISNSSAAAQTGPTTHNCSTALPAISARGAPAATARPARRVG